MASSLALLYFSMFIDILGGGGREIWPPHQICSWVLEEPLVITVAVLAFPFYLFQAVGLPQVGVRGGGQAIPFLDLPCGGRHTLLLCWPMNLGFLSLLVFWEWDLLSCLDITQTIESCLAKNSRSSGSHTICHLHVFRGNTEPCLPTVLRQG